jgi:hypothetical protein
VRFIASSFYDSGGGRFGDADQRGVGQVAPGGSEQLPQIRQQCIDLLRIKYGRLDQHGRGRYRRKRRVCFDPVLDGLAVRSRPSDFIDQPRRKSGRTGLKIGVGHGIGAVKEQLFGNRGAP